MRNQIPDCVNIIIYKYVSLKEGILIEIRDKKGDCRVCLELSTVSVNKSFGLGESKNSLAAYFARFIHKGLFFENFLGISHLDSHQSSGTKNCLRLRFLSPNQNYGFVLD